MTTWPPANYWNVATRTEGEQKVFGEDFLAATKQLPGAAASSTLTIVSDQITPTTGYHNVDTQGGAATDNVAQILQTNLPDGSILYLSIATAGHTVVFKHAAGGTGQLALMGGVDFSMTATTMLLMLRRNGTGWEERGRFYGTAGAEHRSFYGIPGFGQNRFTGRQEWNQGANITAAAMLPIGTDGNYFSVFGSTTITSIASAPAGTMMTLHFLGSPLLVQTANLLELGGANLQVEPLMVLEFVSHGAGVWRLKGGGGGGSTAVRVLNRQLGATTNASQSPQTLYAAVIPAGSLGTLRRARLTIHGFFQWREGGDVSGDHMDIQLFYGGASFTNFVPFPAIAAPSGGLFERFVLESYLSNANTTGTQLGHTTLTCGTNAPALRGAMDSAAININSAVDQTIVLLAGAHATTNPTTVGMGAQHCVLELV